MKRATILGLAAAFIASLSIFSTAPAQAAVRTCTLYNNPNDPGWPTQTNNLYTCFPSPHNQAEASLQTDMKLKAAGSPSNLDATSRSIMANKGTNVYVFYNPQDAKDTLSLVNFSTSTTISGFSYSYPSAQPGLNGRPTSLIFVFTASQWAAIPNQTPTSYDVNQLMGTVHHELGHQMDARWTEITANAPQLTAGTNRTISANATLFIAQVTKDASAISATDRNNFHALYPGFFIPGTTNWSISELTAEFFAIYSGGGTSNNADTILSNLFPCSVSHYMYWTIHQNGVLPTGAPGTVGFCP